MTSAPATPPRAARRLLAALAPPDLADDVVANVDDLHAARVFRDGRWRAGGWYWRQAIWLPIRLRVSDVPLPIDSPSLRTLSMRHLLQDLAYAIRMYRARPGFTLVAVTSLTLAIGFNTAIFSVVDGVLLRPAPFAAFDRLVMVWETDRNTGTTREPASIPDFLDYRASTRTLASLGALIAQEANLAPPGGDPTRVAALRVTHDLLPVFGVTPIAGRALGPDDEAGGAPVALISEALWTRLFDRQPIAGRTIVLNDNAIEVVGVVPDSTDFGILQVLSSAAYSRSFADRGVHLRVDVWLPLQPDPQALPRSTHPAFMIGRLAPDASVAAAQAELADLASQLEVQYASDNTGRGINVEALSAVVFGPVRPAFLALLGAVGLVLVVACVNIANLLLAQGESRRREVAVRAALGAGRARLARQFLTESVLLAGVSGLAGVALAGALLAWLVSLAPADVPRLASATIDLRVLGVMVGVVLTVGVGFGLVPTLQAGRATASAALAAGADRAAGGRARTRLRAALVSAELALAVVLVVGAGLLIQSVAHLQAVDPGFESERIAKAEYQLPASRYPVNFATWPDFREQHAFTSALVERARALPGVAAVAVAGNHPMDPGFTNSFLVVGREAEASSWPEISIRRVTDGYFATVGLRLLDGRLFDSSDSTTGAPVVLINAAARDRFFPGGAAIGHEIFFWGARRRIVGVVDNERFQGLTTSPPIAVYAPLAQTPSTNGAGVLLVRTDGHPDRTLGALPRVIREIDPALAVFGLEALTDTLGRASAKPRFTASLVGLFALMALVLAAIGVHGVLAYSVTQRTREIGIRMALGARPERVRRQVVGEGLWLAAIGLAVGLAGAAVLSRFVESLLFGVASTDPRTYLGVSAVLLAVALLASYAPARLATRVDPATALRSQA